MYQYQYRYRDHGWPNWGEKKGPYSERKKGINNYGGFNNKQYWVWQMVCIVKRPQQCAAVNKKLL